MPENQNQNKYQEEDLDVSLEDIMDVLLANSDGDQEAAAAFELACRKNCPRGHLLIGQDATKIVRLSRDAQKEYHCIITPAAESAVLKYPDGLEIHLKTNREFAEFIQTLRNSITNERGEGPEAVFDENAYIELPEKSDASPITFSDVLELLAIAVPADETVALRKYVAQYRLLSHEHVLLGDEILIVVCDTPPGAKHYLDVPSYQCQISPAARTVTLSREGFDQSRDFQITFHPDESFFQKLLDTSPEAEVSGSNPVDEDATIVYPNEKAFSNKRNDKKQAQFELWHNTPAINELLRGLLKVGASLEREKACVRNFIRQVHVQSDLYCMTIKGGTLQIVCLGERGAVSQCVVISMAAKTVVVSSPGAGVTWPLKKDYERHVIETLKQFKKELL